MELCTLASGSKGNATIIKSEQGFFLVDAGISTKRIEQALALLGEKAEEIDAVFITHEHRDHISGLKTLLKKYQFPVFTTKGTMEGIFSTRGFEGIEKSLFHPIESSASFLLKDCLINTFPLPHDAKEPVGFTFLKEEKKLAVCTDIGKITESIKENLSGCNALLLEANHDEHILQAGPYPYQLKKRILGDFGHLSNENSGRLLAKLWKPELKHVILGHLSDENNMPELALMSVRCELLNKIKDFETYTKLSVAPKDGLSERVIV